MNSDSFFPSVARKIYESGPTGIVAAVLICIAVCTAVAWVILAVSRRKAYLLAIISAMLVATVGLWLFRQLASYRSYNLESLILPSDYTLEHRRGDDSYFGRITRTDGFSITFDAGIGAGLAAHPRQREEHKFVWWREQNITGEKIWLGLRDDGPSGRWLLVTYRKNGANFSAQIKSDGDVAEALTIILTYKPLPM